jgi:hypothetical protein
MKVTITRRRLVVQVSSQVYDAGTTQEALALANQDQDSQVGNDSDWDNTEAIEYPALTPDDVSDVG